MENGCKRQGGICKKMFKSGISELSGIPGKDVTDTTEERLQRNEYKAGQITGSGYWTTEPELGRVAHGIPNRVDRLKCLGNAIVPQVAYEIFKAIDKLFPQ